MPMRRELYPPDWESISRRVRDEAGNRCEWCGVANGARGARDQRKGEWFDEDDSDGMNSSEGEWLFGGYPKIIRIVLTVAHIDHDQTNGTRQNLAALCQRCHLNHDREQHMVNAAKTRARKRDEAIAATGQLTLIQEGGRATL